MNLGYLGDALDHWKGSILESLQHADLLSDFFVEPMITDDVPWQATDCAIYARLLRITTGQIIRHNNTLRTRNAYFAEITHRGDLFLDPDTGVSTSKGGEKYVLPKEIGDLLDNAPTRLLILYQHIRAQRCADRINCVISKLQSKAGHFHWCSYESPSVALVFLSRDRSRAQQVEQHFKSVLRNHAEKRIRGSV